MAGGLRRGLVDELGPRLADRLGEEAQAALLHFPAYRREAVADPFRVDHASRLAQFVRWYIVTTQAPPRPRLCCSAVRAPSTCRGQIGRASGRARVCQSG